MEENNSNKQNTPIDNRPLKAKRINWGTGIVIAFVLFISFILYFIIKVQANPKYDHEMVVEEYYKNDAKYGDEMIRIKNAMDLKHKPTITASFNGVSIVFPDEFVFKDVKGNVTFYRPSDKKFDFSVPISLSNSKLYIPKEKLLVGRWDINMEWQYHGKSYLTKEVVYFE
jgi:nitrogen fixation protein FixH